MAKIRQSFHLCLLFYRIVVNKEILLSLINTSTPHQIAGNTDVQGKNDGEVLFNHLTIYLTIHLTIVHDVALRSGHFQRDGLVVGHMGVVVTLKPQFVHCQPQLDAGAVVYTDTGVLLTNDLQQLAGIQ